MASENGTRETKSGKPAETNHVTPVSQEEHEEYGCSSWRPSALQFIATGRFFCVFLCWVVASDAFNSGTFGSAVTSIETRYQLPSRQLGFINSMYELASLVLVVFVVYYGGRPTSNRPLWIGLGAMLMGVGAFVTLLPQIFFGIYKPNVGSTYANETGANLCHVMEEVGPETCSAMDKETEAGNKVAFVIIVCGQIIVGLGWTPVMALGMSYIDDNVKTSTSAMHIGYVQSMFGFGRIAGFLVGGVTVTKWVDFYRDDPEKYGVGPQDAQWVGAWWIGLIISGIMYICSGIPLLGFPRSIPIKNADEEQDFMGSASKAGTNDAKAKEAGELPKRKVRYRSFSDIPRAFWKVLKNPLYMVMCLAFVTEFAAQIGLVIFFAKYLETQFGLTASKANLITGSTLVPASAIGSILGGYLVKKLKTKADGSCKLALVLSAVAMGLLLLTFGMGCDTVSTAGVTTPYTSQTSMSLNRTDLCNINCQCETDVYSPVCGDDGITYVSPCHAGCTQQSEDGTFSNCTCITGGEDATAVDGTCYKECNTLIPFLIFTFLVVVISGAEEIPQTLITMRCVDADSKAIALGVRAILMRLLGAIPAPLIYGAMIDTACRLWQTTCGAQGSCWLYDLPAFRYSYLGVNLIFKFLTVVFYVLGWYLIRRRRMDNEDNEGNNE